MISEFEAHGAVRAADVFDHLGLLRLAALVDAERPGVRLLDSRLPDLVAPATRLAASLIGANARPVRAVLFDKTPQSNWALGWHQDRTILVLERLEAPGFGPWSKKDGALHVAPPVDVLRGMATLRIHIDPCGPENAPLKVALGSHRHGLVTAREARPVAERHQVIDCVAQAGDVWAYRTLILHSSDRAAVPQRRRVLQLDYAAEDLPSGLQWRGVCA